MHLLIAEADGCCRIERPAGVPDQEIEVRIRTARLGRHSSGIERSGGVLMF
jgi:hypothetical protein